MLVPLFEMPCHPNYLHLHSCSSTNWWISCVIIFHVWLYPFYLQCGYFLLLHNFLIHHSCGFHGNWMPILDMWNGCLWVAYAFVWNAACAFVVLLLSSFGIMGMQPTCDASAEFSKFFVCAVVTIWLVCNCRPPFCTFELVMMELRFLVLHCLLLKHAYKSLSVSSFHQA